MVREFTPFELNKLDTVKRIANPLEARYFMVRYADGVRLRQKYGDIGQSSQWGYGRESQGKAQHNAKKNTQPVVPNVRVIRYTASGHRIKTTRKEVGF